MVEIWSNNQKSNFSYFFLIIQNQGEKVYIAINEKYQIWMSRVL